MAMAMAMQMVMFLNVTYFSGNSKKNILQAILS
jgi:hypothetical protein